ncbi:hypothetical protein K440DRAFT_326452 [Wilcoxina mikolae CBS 423.85]|nr:hypothetical protein K440DRAFT_326452 [Wilcoxina mikolae CBS 423.85]
MGHPEAETKDRGVVKKKSSFRSLFSIFRSSKPAKESAVATSYSTSSLPSGAQRSLTASDGGSSDTDLSSDDAELSAISLPDQIKLPFSYTPSSSSSSASSFDFASDASTTATTPSNSSPSVLMKASDMSNGEFQSDKSLPKRRLSESHRKQPSPLSTVTDAHNSPYMLPSPPVSEVLRERRSSLQPDRRNSLGRLLSRAYRSNPDLTTFDDGDSSSVHMMPSSAPSSRPASSNGSSSRSRKFGKKNGGEKGRGDVEKRTNPEQERMERRSILGADPAGVGFYLYPKTAQPEPSIQKVNVMGSGRSGLSGPDNGRRAWREQKGRSFQRTIATPMIVEEDGNGNDTYELPPFPNPQRRHSRISMHDGQLRQPRFHADQPAPPLSATSSRSQVALPSIDSLLDGEAAKAGPSTPKHSRQRSLHNSWDQINAHKKLHQQISALEVPPRNSESAVLSLCCEESTLRYWRQEGMHEGKVRSDVINDGEFDTSQSRCMVGEGRRRISLFLGGM